MKIKFADNLFPIYIVRKWVNKGGYGQYIQELFIKNTEDNKRNILCVNDGESYQAVSATSDVERFHCAVVLMVCRHHGLA